jgi:tryptophan-rich sensory protein
MSIARSVVGLVACLAACFAAAAIGGFFTGQSVSTWYQELQRPAWNPPDWVFGPVWTVLYLTMAVAAWLVWRQGGWSGARTALGLFIVQLVLNAAWTGVFFGLRAPGPAFAELAVLWIAIVATILAFWQKSPAAGALMLPYLGWSSYAAVLNFTIWRMNG